MTYSSNKLSVAVYPICLEFKTEDDGPVHKGTITFISDDKLHDHQQVKAMEKTNVWWSDGCGAQPKSQFANEDLVQAKGIFELLSASFAFFESHEGICLIPTSM